MSNEIKQSEYMKRLRSGYYFRIGRRPQVAAPPRTHDAAIQVPDQDDLEIAAGSPISRPVVKRSVVNVTDHHVRGKRTGVRFFVKLRNVSVTVLYRAEEIAALERGQEALREYLQCLRARDNNRFSKMIRNSPSLLDYLGDDENEDEEANVEDEEPAV